MGPILFDASPVHWKFPSGISIAVAQLFGHLDKISRHSYRGLNFGLRPWQTTPCSVRTQWAPGYKLRARAGVLSQVPIGPGLAFVATSHFIPLFNGPVIYQIYDCIKAQYPNEMRVDRSDFLLKSRQLISRCNGIVVNSRSTADDVRRLFRPEVPIEVAPLGVDTDMFRPDGRKWNVERHWRGPFIYSAGVVQPRKRFDWAFQLVRELGNEYAFVATGALDPYGRRLWDELCATFPDVRAVHLGLVSRERQAQLYRAASLFVFPSVMEGFGLPVLEAMACGCPVLVTDHSSLPEIVSDPGQRFDRDCMHEFVRKSGELLTLGKHERERLAGANRSRALQFDIMQAAEAFERALLRMVSSS